MGAGGDMTSCQAGKQGSPLAWNDLGMGWDNGLGEQKQRVGHSLCSRDWAFGDSPRGRGVQGRTRRIAL